MNDNRKKEINRVIEQLDELRSEIERIAEEEGDDYDNLPEAIQYSERGERMTEVVRALEDQAFALEDIINELTDTKD